MRASTKRSQHRRPKECCREIRIVHRFDAYSSRYAAVDERYIYNRACGHVFCRRLLHLFGVRFLIHNICAFVFVVRLHWHAGFNAC